MRPLAFSLATCAAVVWATGLGAQQADPVASANNPPQVSQSVPRLIMFSGTLKDLAGIPLTGPVDIHAAIYKEQTDAETLWQETQTLNLDEQGHYTVLLGAMQPEGLPVELFTSGEARWLGVGAGRLPEQPRVLLVSVPYALKANDAEMLAGKPASAYALAPSAEGATSAGAARAGTTAAGGVAIPELAAPRKPESGAGPAVAGTSTQNYLPLWTDSVGTLGNSVMYQNGSNLGVGTTTPAVALDVSGTNAGLRVVGLGTHQVTVTGVTSGRLGQDAVGLFFASDTNGAPVRFATNNGSLNERMRITSAGNVGIGTATPAHLLDVVGDINARTNINAGGNLRVAGTISGNGSLLQNLAPGNIAAGTAAIDISGNANTANSAVSAGFASEAGSLSCKGCVTNSQVSLSYALADTQGGNALNALNLGGLPTSSFANVGSNTFSGTQTISSGDSSISNGNLDLSQTVSAGVGVLNLGGSAFLHACCSATQYNTFVGANAGNFTITGGGNAASGYDALNSNIDGSDNSALGYAALYSNTAGSYNTASGNGALFSNTEGSFNTASGTAALYSNTTASFNTALGYYAGLTSTSEYANVTGSNNTFLGALSGPGTSTPLTNATAIGYQALVSASNSVVLGGTGDSAVNVGIGTQTPAVTLQVVGDIRIGTSDTNGCVQNYAGAPLSGVCSSDARLKTNIQPFSPVLGRLVQLQPVHYIWNVAAYPQYHFGPGINSGLIAQAVEKVFPELVAEDGRGFKQVNYGELPYLMLQAIRELKADNDALRGQVEELNAKNQKITELTRQVEELQTMQQKVATFEARLAEMEARTPKP